MKSLELTKYLNWFINYSGHLIAVIAFVFIQILYTAYSYLTDTLWFAGKILMQIKYLGPRYQRCWRTKS